MSRGQKLTALGQAKYALENGENLLPPESPCPTVSEEGFPIFSEKLYQICRGLSSATPSDSPPRKVLKDLSSNRTATYSSRNVLAPVSEKRKANAVRKLLNFPLESPARVHCPGVVDVLNNTAALSMFSCYDSEDSRSSIPDMGTPKKTSTDNNNNQNLTNGAPLSDQVSPWVNGNIPAQKPCVPKPFQDTFASDMDESPDKENNNGSFGSFDFDFKGVAVCSTPVASQQGNEETNDAVGSEIQRGTVAGGNHTEKVLGVHDDSTDLSQDSSCLGIGLLDEDESPDKTNGSVGFFNLSDNAVCSTPLVPNFGLNEINIAPLQRNEQGQEVVGGNSLTSELPLSDHSSELSKDAVAFPQSDIHLNTTSISFLGEHEVTEELCGNIISVLDASAGDAIVVPLEVEIANPVTAVEALNTEDVEVIVEEQLVQDVEEVLPDDIGNGPNTPDDTPKPRSRNPQRWKKVEIKRKKDLGLAHISQRGKVREECRTVTEACKNTCKRKCSQIFTEDDRKSVNAAFWDIGNHTQQWYYIKGLVKEEEVKRRTVITLHGMRPYRRATYTYHLPLNGTLVVVCQKMFLSTLHISVTWIKTAMKKFKSNNGTIPGDNRGKKPKTAVVGTVIKAGIMAHIKKFPTVEGHYTRKNSKSMYLAENLNRRKMWSIYKMEMEAAGAEKIGTLRQYRDVFNKEFRLKFFRPKKDQCPKCLSWKHKTPQERTEAAQKKYEAHIKNKKISQEIKEKDIDEVMNSPELRKTKCLLTCDLEKVLMCPKGENGAFYYASKLSVHNFTIFVSGDQDAFCYVWDQTIAGKGAAEIGSCLWSFIQQKVEQGIKEFLIYSDNCSPQNKNQFLFSMYVMASIRFNIKITHRYLEVGHTHMECDSIHATIEKSVKHTDIFVPSQWYQAMKTAKKTRPFYKVKEMSQEEIFDFRPLAAHQLWENVKTSLFREVSIDGETPGLISYKRDMEGPSTVVNIFKKTRGRPVNWHTFKLTQRYAKRIPLREVELKALQGLCSSGAIPSAYWPYYNISLPALLEDAQEPTPPPELSDVDSNFSSDEDSDKSGEEDEEGEEEDEGEEDGGEGEEEENDSD